MKKHIFILILVWAIYGCSESTKNNSSNGEEKYLPEHQVEVIKLEGAITKDYSEISGLAWMGENLILLPQFPHKFSAKNDGIIWKIPKERIISYIKGEDKTPIEPEEINFLAEGLDEYGKKLGGGYEAIAFDSNRVFVSIECFNGGETFGVLVSGKYNDAENKITLDKNTLVKINSQSNKVNFSEEAILFSDNKIYTFHEANGKNVNPKPVAHLLELSTQKLSTVPFPTTEYRITDVTSADKYGNFWAINYYYIGETDKLIPVEDYYVKNFGYGKTQKEYGTVERLLEFKISGNEIIRTTNPPLLLSQNGEGRNWEGIVRLQEDGFLIATDKFPETILAFLKFHPEE